MKPRSEIYVLGAGGHAKVVISAARQCGMCVVCVFDDDPEKIGTMFCGVPVVGSTDAILTYPPRPTAIAIGDNCQRLHLADQYKLSWATIFHPSAIVDPSAEIGAGTVILAGAVVQAEAVIGDHVIVNDNATVEHDCHVGRGTHISCNACLTGGVEIGSGAMIGAGAVILPEIRVGEFATVGAGTVALKDVRARATVVGSPARELRANWDPVVEPSDRRIYLSPPHMSPSERELLLDAFDSNWIAPLGPHVDAFEEEFANKVGTRHAVALSSGTAALHLALLVAGVGAGDIVLTSTLTFAATANAIRYVGAVPVFIDSEAASWNMDSQLLRDAIQDCEVRGRLPKAAVVVDICGQCADWDQILAVCRQYGIVVIEDAAEALGATYKGRPAGTLGDIGCFSFNGNKIITTSGGGMLITEEESWAQRTRHLATQARDNFLHYEHSVVGYNYRLSNLLAAVGRGQLQQLDNRVARRRAVFDFYRNSLGDIPGVEFMPEAGFGRSTRWLSCLLLHPRLGLSPSDVCARLATENIEARPMWKPMHLQPVFSECGRIGGGVAESIFRRGLCLPSGSNLSQHNLERIAKAFRKALMCGESQVA